MTINSTVTTANLWVGLMSRIGIMVSLQPVEIPRPYTLVPQAAPLQRTEYCHKIQEKAMFVNKMEGSAGGGKNAVSVTKRLESTRSNTG
jgi:hypothetical protein